jgi:uncharacterized protein YjbJ (UPF0337 family)
MDNKDQITGNVKQPIGDLADDAERRTFALVCGSWRS